MAEAARPYWDRWFGNPSSSHAYGEHPRQAVARARERVAALIGATAGEIIFTGSGSEADQLAIRGTLLAGLRAVPGATPRVITQVTEHRAVLASCATLEQWQGARVTRLPVDSFGLVSPQAVADALARPAGARSPAVVSAMLANKTGTIQPVTQIAAAAHAHGAVVHVDAAQAAGKTSIDATALGADLLTVVGHKMYAPKGIAALYVRPGTALEPVIYGGGQERGLRADTENVALITALGTAAELAARDLAVGAESRLADLRDRLHTRLAVTLPGRIQLTARQNGGCPQRSTSASPDSAATNCSPPRASPPPPPAPPATAASTNPPGYSRRWAWTRTAPWPRSGCPSAAGPARLTSTPLPASSPKPPSA